MEDLSDAGDNGNKSADSCRNIRPPQSFLVKYLGKRESAGLWGIKYTRKPVDDMVITAKTMKLGESLPFLRLEISDDGIMISEMPQNLNKNFEGGLYPIECISYGVQDIVYTRVFAMIVVRETSNLNQKNPFECHAFVCDSRQNARRLTLCLASVFRELNSSFKSLGASRKELLKKFAVDLRSPEEIHAELEGLKTADDSEV